MTESDTKEYRKMVSELLDLESGLSDREIEFLENLNRWTSDFREKQIDWLYKIWNRVM